MIYSTQELYLKYKNYKTPHIKISTEVKNNRLFPVFRGLYEDKKYVDGYLHINYLRTESYLSFEYVLSKYNLIPERVYLYTCATTLKKHTTNIKTPYGNYLFRDIPVDAYRYGIRCVKEGDYAYLIASPEKALCDLLYTKRNISSIKALKELLFEDLRIDEELFLNLNKEDMIFLCSLYKKKIFKYFKKYLEKLQII